MKYLFTYAYAGTKGGIPTSGQGSMIMTTPEKGITEKLIYDDENGAISIAKKSITDIDNLQLTPMGWYKFDNVWKEQNDNTREDKSRDS